MRERERERERVGESYFNVVKTIEIFIKKEKEKEEDKIVVLFI